jgi:hypothetical protein
MSDTLRAALGRLREKWTNYALRYPDSWSVERQRIDDFIADLNYIDGMAALAESAPTPEPPSDDIDVLRESMAAMVESHANWVKRAYRAIKRAEAAEAKLVAPPPAPQTCATCHICGKPATCLGQYDNMTDPAYACDSCCGHGCEDGRCMTLPCATDGGPQ